MQKVLGNIKYLVVLIIIILIIVLALLNITDNTNSTKLGSKLFGFGSNYSSQLGKLNSFKSPVDIQSLEVLDVKDFDGGNKHTVILLNSGEVYQLGSNGIAQESLERYIEFKDKDNQTKRLNNIVAVSAGADYSLALDSAGFVWAWGSNLTAQLGDGTNDSSIYAKKINELSKIKSISAGYKFALALKEDGSVWAWGGSCSQEKKDAAALWLSQPILKVGIGGYYDPTSLGTADGSDLNNQSEDFNSYCANEYVIGFSSKTPIEIKDIPVISTISAGWGHSLLIDSQGFVWSFGCNLYNQLGPTPNHLVPFKIPNLKNIVKVSAGFRHSLALDALGNVYSWGYNLRGSLGLQTISESETIPQKIKTQDVIDLAASHDFSTLLFKNGKITIFGENNSGVISNNLSTIYSPNPTSKDLNLTFSKISAGKSFILTLSNNEI